MNENHEDAGLAYGYPQYVRVAELIAVRMAAAFCAFVKDWCDGDNLKRALFYTSKQHNYLQRAACLTILSIFGELTVELCTTIIEALHDDPHIQNTCYRCLTRINSTKAIRRNELNDIDADFAESRKAARLSSCLYEKKTEENLQLPEPAKIKSVD